MTPPSPPLAFRFTSPSTSLSHHRSRPIHPPALGPTTSHCSIARSSRPRPLCRPAGVLSRMTSTSTPSSSVGGGNAQQPVAPPQPPPPQQLSRYESQKWRDWNTFLEYLRNHRPPLTLARCSGAHVIEFLKYLDQFGKTKVHESGCAHYGQPMPPAPCQCPLRQAWGSLDALIGRLRASYAESGHAPESSPFAERSVRIYLREVRDTQAKARGIPYVKKKRKRTQPTRALPAGAAAGGTSSSSATAAGTGGGGGEQSGSGTAAAASPPAPTGAQAGGSSSAAPGTSRV